MKSGRVFLVLDFKKKKKSPPEGGKERPPAPLPTSADIHTSTRSITCTYGHDACPKKKKAPAARPERPSGGPRPQTTRAVAGAGPLAGNAHTSRSTRIHNITPTQLKRHAGARRGVAVRCRSAAVAPHAGAAMRRRAVVERHRDEHPHVRPRRADAVAEAAAVAAAAARVKELEDVVGGEHKVSPLGSERYSDASGAIDQVRAAKGEGRRKSPSAGRRRKIVKNDSARIRLAAPCGYNASRAQSRLDSTPDRRPPAC